MVRITKLIKSNTRVAHELSYASKFRVLDWVEAALDPALVRVRVVVFLS